MKTVAAIVLLLAGLAGCSYPVEQVRQVEDRPSLLVEGAPANAILVVDGINLGLVRSSIDGRPQAILVEPGTHEVQVSAQGRPLLSERVFVSGSGTKTLTVTGVPR